MVLHIDDGPKIRYHHQQQQQERRERDSSSIAPHFGYLDDGERSGHSNVHLPL